MEPSAISPSGVWRPRLIAAWIRLCVSGSRTPSPKRSESRRKSSTGASAIALTRSLTVAWPAAGNPAIRWASERDEIAELVGGQRSVDPAVPFGQLRVVVLGAQHDLERSGAAHEASEVLGGAPAGEQTERRLELTEDRRLARGEAHVARQHELAAGGADATLDLRDGDEAACAQMAEQNGDRRLAGQLRRLRPVLGDPGQIDVGDEVVGVGARNTSTWMASSASAR